MFLYIKACTRTSGLHERRFIIKVVRSEEMGLRLVLDCMLSLVLLTNNLCIYVALRLVQIGYTDGSSYACSPASELVRDQLKSLAKS